MGDGLGHACRNRLLGGVCLKSQLPCVFKKQACLAHVDPSLRQSTSPTKDGEDLKAKRIGRVNLVSQAAVCTEVDVIRGSRDDFVRTRLGSQLPASSPKWVVLEIPVSWRAET